MRKAIAGTAARLKNDGKCCSLSYFRSHLVLSSPTRKNADPSFIPKRTPEIAGTESATRTDASPLHDSER